MEKKWQISRRTMLKGLGAAISLPLLEVMQPLTALASTLKDPVRMAFLYFPNGIVRGTWDPRKVGPDGRLELLNEWMSPLEPFKEDIIVPTNMWTPEGNGHGAGTATWLTGYGYDGAEISAGGESVDQFAARQIGHKTLLPSLELSAKGEGFFSKNLPRNAISWNSANVPVPREIEPRVVFDRMFRTGEGGASDRSVLDLVLAQAKSLQSRVGTADKAKLEEYLESVRAIERRLDFAKKQSTILRQADELTDTLTRPERGIPSDHQEYIRLMLDMMVLAFQSDATRVCSFMLDHGQSNRYFNFIDNVSGTWHALSHYENFSGNTEDDDGKTSWNTRQEKSDMFCEVTRWHHKQLAYLLGRMKEIREGDGTLLDNTMILYGSSLGDGNEHDKEDLPTIIAGRGGGTIRTGRQIVFEEPENMSNFHLSMLDRMGIEVDQFAKSTREISELA